MPQRATEVVNLPLGVIEPTSYVQFAVKLDKDDLVLIYTDALTEARNAEGRRLGEKGLIDLVRRLDTHEPQELIAKVLTEYHGRASAEDDETLLVLHHNAADPPKQSIGQRIHVMAKMLGLIGD